MTVDIYEFSYCVASFTNKPNELKKFLLDNSIKLKILEVRSKKFKEYGFKKAKD